MLLLCLNCGGSSMKYQLLAMPEEKVVAKGSIDRLFTPDAVIKHLTAGEEPLEEVLPEATFTEGVRWLIKKLLHDRVINEVGDLTAVAHKLAHGGEHFRAPVLIDEQVLTAITDLFCLAPVHLPPAVAGIRVCQELMPGIAEYAVFETNFHQSIPPYAYIYGLPYEWYQKYGIRKYGFHGTSHRYVSETAAQLAGRKIEELKIVSCHLGSGTSVAAVKAGKSLDISSGLTPQSGIIMSTRPGDFDPWVFMFMSEQGMSLEEINQAMVKRGGLLGISGLSGDMRDLEAAAPVSERAELAIAAFCYQVKKYIGAFTGLMNGLDVLIFTGGIGERSPLIRARICSEMDYLGIELDQARNVADPRPDVLSPNGAGVQVMTIDTNEELMVARQVADLLIE